MVLYGHRGNHGRHGHYSCHGRDVHHGHQGHHDHHGLSSWSSVSSLVSVTSVNSANIASLIDWLTESLHLFQSNGSVLQDFWQGWVGRLSSYLSWTLSAPLWMPSYIIALILISRDGSININEFTTLCTALFRNEAGKPYKLDQGKHLSKHLFSRRFLVKYKLNQGKTWSNINLTRVNLIIWASKR